MWDEGQKHNLSNHLKVVVVTEVKLHCFHVSAAMAAKFVLTFMNEYGNSKLFEL